MERSHFPIPNFIGNNKVHHITNSKENCDQCKKPIKYFWFDEKEMNGQSEVTYTNSEKQNICTDCKIKNSGGIPPLGLFDYQEIKHRGITSKQYYQEKGYKI